MSFIHTGDRVPIAPAKDPDSVVWYGAAWDGVVPEGTALTSEWIVPDDMTIDDQRTDEASDGYERVNKVLLSGGESGSLVKITNRVTFGDQVMDRSMLIRVDHL